MAASSKLPRPFIAATTKGRDGIFGQLQNKSCFRAAAWPSRQGSGDFWAQPAKKHPFTTSTGFLKIWPVANLLPFIWTGQYIYIYIFQVPANFFFIVTTTSQELGHWQVSQFYNVAKLWNAIMKQKLRMFIIHQTVISLQHTYNSNLRTIWYTALDESNRIKSAHLENKKINY
jgi:hypothetical protein